MSRFWCKTCEIFIDDNKIARKQHDLSERHKAGIKRAINDLHRSNRDEIKAQREAEKTAGTYRNPRVKTTKNQLSTENDTTDRIDENSSPLIGEWEEIEPQPQPQRVLRTLGSPLKDPEEDLPLPKKELQLPPSEMESKNWDFDQKKVEDNLSDEEENKPPTKAVTFKKRRVKQ